MRLILLFLASCAHWTPSEVTAEALALAATTADWHQTQDITGACEESNPVLGPCGRAAPVNLYFPVAMAAHVLIANALPHRWRLAWSALTLGAEVNQVWMNYEAQPGLSYSQGAQARRLP